ncbi:MAG: MerR family transcriptional regulator [Solirubrobacterales bacterium]
MTPPSGEGPKTGPVGSSGSRRRKALTIGAVARMLSKDFDDISISKIRYLEDQKLVSPRRTPGGYRLYSQADVDRLKTILRLQRDEFLPLRVIRQELASGKVAVERSGGGENRTRRARLLMASSERLDLVGLAEETGAEPELLRDLIDYGLVGKPPSPDTEIYDETDVAVVNAAAELVKAGIGPRNLKTFRTSADRESQLVEALLAPKLVSRNPQRRKEAVESLERIATSMGELKQSLLVRDLRRFANS